MYENQQFKHKFIDCTTEESEILNDYWSCDEQGNFNYQIKDICSKYNITNAKLSTLVRRKSKLSWDFGYCNCGSPIVFEIINRANLKACLKDRGDVNECQTSRVSSHFSKCEGCRKAARTSLRSYSFDSYNIDPWPSPFGDSPLEDPDRTTAIKNKIKVLSAFELKILRQIYSLKDFDLIKESKEIFPIKYGEHHRATWRTLYKLGEKNLITVTKDWEGLRIADIGFHAEVEEVLKYDFDADNTTQPFEEALTMERISDIPNKYYTILEPEKDTVLKAGAKYEIIATESWNKNLIIRIINASSI